MFDFLFLSAKVSVRPEGNVPKAIRLRRIVLKFIEIMIIPLVWIISGSVSDAPVMRAVQQVLDELGIPNESNALSAHRTPDDVAERAKTARARGIKVIVAGAGGAAHLPGVIASNTLLPVIGVPIAGSGALLGGLDAVLSILQMPPGVPVAAVAVNGGKNAALLAARILALCPEHANIAKRLAAYQQKMEDDVKKANEELHSLGFAAYADAHPPKKK